MPYVDNTIVPLTGGWDLIDLGVPCRQIRIYNSSAIAVLQWAYSNSGVVDGQAEIGQVTPMFDTRRFMPHMLWILGTIGETYSITGVPG